MKHYNARHFNQRPVRNAEFITPPNLLKQKVGQGGLSDAVLEKAETILKNNNIDFIPMAERYLNNLAEGIEHAKYAHSSGNVDKILAHIIYPAMQLKANGGMFHYPLVTVISDRLVQFLEVINDINENAIEIIYAFHTSLRAVISSRLHGDGGKDGTELIVALNEACTRYFEKEKEERSSVN